MGSRYTFINKETHFHFDNKCLWLPIEHPHLVLPLFSLAFPEPARGARQAEGLHNSISLLLPMPIAAPTDLMGLPATVRISS